MSFLCYHKSAFSLMLRRYTITWHNGIKVSLRDDVIGTRKRRLVAFCGNKTTAPRTPDIYAWRSKKLMGCLRPFAVINPFVLGDVNNARYVCRCNESQTTTILVSPHPFARDFGERDPLIGWTWLSRTFYHPKGIRFFHSTILREFLGRSVLK